MMTINESVILLHGLLRSAWSLRRIERALQPDYQVINRNYPSRKHSIETLADLAISPALEACDSAERVHFVTHSLGGILVRQYLSRNRIDNLGRVVMLGPPNQGSELVDAFSRRLWFKAINGPTGQQLGTDQHSVPMQLGAVDFDVGVIAGDRNYNPVFKRIIQGPDDGKVSVASSKIEGMNDHLVLPVNHTFMMLDNRVINQVKHYLTHGRFAPDSV